MNTIRAKKTISCDTCGCSMARTKSIKVQSSEKQQAIVESREKFADWVQSLKGQNCRTCDEIIKQMT